MAPPPRLPSLRHAGRRNASGSMRLVGSDAPASSKAGTGADLLVELESSWHVVLPLSVQASASIPVKHDAMRCQIALYLGRRII